MTERLYWAPDVLDVVQVERRNIRDSDHENIGKTRHASARHGRGMFIVRSHPSTLMLISCQTPIDTVLSS